LMVSVHQVFHTLLQARSIGHKSCLQGHSITRNKQETSAGRLSQGRYLCATIISYKETYTDRLLQSNLCACHVHGAKAEAFNQPDAGSFPPYLRHGARQKVGCKSWRQLYRYFSCFERCPDIQHPTRSCLMNRKHVQLSEVLNITLGLKHPATSRFTCDLRPLRLSVSCLGISVFCYTVPCYRSASVQMYLRGTTSNLTARGNVGAVHSVTSAVFLQHLPITS
jgi:hypothetical protein